MEPKNMNMCKIPQSWTFTGFEYIFQTFLELANHLQRFWTLPQFSSLTLKHIDIYKLRLSVDVLFKCEINGNISKPDACWCHCCLLLSLHPLPPFCLSHNDDQINSPLQLRKILNSSFVLLVKNVSLFAPLYLPPYFSKVVCFCLKKNCAAYFNV